LKKQSVGLQQQSKFFSVDVQLNLLSHDPGAYLLALRVST
jgi:hypothetical protein